MKSPFTFIDLFAGCGGLSEGFVQAGFVPVAHVEMDKDACNTLKTRCCYHYLSDHSRIATYNAYLTGDISRDALYSCVPKEVTDAVINTVISDNTIEETFKKIKKLAGSRNIDMIIGGPPCQAYSLLGRHRKEMEDDPRTLLYVQYGKFLKEFSPKGFVFENVPGLLSAKKGQHFQNLQDYFDELGYTVHYKMLDSSNYGVLQVRHRIILVGWRKDCDLGYPVLEETIPDAIVNNVFDDLPELTAGDVQRVAPYQGQSNAYLRISGIRDDNDTFVTQNITRPLNENDARIYAYAIRLWNSQHVRVKYTDLPRKYRTQKNEHSFLDRFKVVDGGGLSHTVVAHLAKDGHYYIHPSLKQCRSISVREAARLQSFPDNFFFEGGRSAIFKQIGNAVPVLMANKIASEIIKMLFNHE
ncbi:MAG: DNA (cytosine-5-)-methyltransferase [Bacteroidales bacterium]|nr:DNA (cytosine-5-)-methyltransferase [Bacteroidales bacterium]